MPLAEPPPPDPDPSRCHLLGPTALVVQALMGVFVIASLVIKRQLEKRKRKWKIWLWDVCKQLVGQAVVHALNLLISDLVAHAADNNPCSLYFLNVAIDTTVGVAIFYFALKGFTWLFTTHLALEGYKSGHYGDPPDPIFWWRQLVPYLLSIVTMKLLVLLPLTLPGISSLLLRFGYAVLQYLNPAVQVIFVMAFFPLVMNVIQFCLVDQVIKGGIVDVDQYERVDAEAPESTKGSPVVPSSPLLSADDINYGSTSPSPQPSAEGTWSRMLRDDRLDARERRSLAPSPESPPMFASVSRLSEDAGREARRSLSPKTRAAYAKASREALGMTER